MEDDCTYQLRRLLILYTEHYKLSVINDIDSNGFFPVRLCKYLLPQLSIVSHPGRRFYYTNTITLAMLQKRSHKKSHTLNSKLYLFYTWLFRNFSSFWTKRITSSRNPRFPIIFQFPHSISSNLFCPFLLS